jgi:hypothetical protein
LVQGDAERFGTVSWENIGFRGKYQFELVDGLVVQAARTKKALAAVKTLLSLMDTR